MAEVVVTIGPDGLVKVEGEGFETAALKKDLKTMGDVVEEHIGSEHVKIVTEQHQQNKA